MSGRPIVFFDSETGGLLPQHPTIQLAAIAVDSDFRELETWERKIAFDERQADPEALAMNHYDRAVWQKWAVAESMAVAEFGALLNRYRCVELISQRTGRPYAVARVAGHNVAGFDIDRVSAMFKRCGAFFPVDFRSTLDTRYGAIWFFEGGCAALDQRAKPKSYKLTDVAEYFGIDRGGAHDALFDVRLSIAIAARLVAGWQGTRREVA